MEFILIIIGIMLLIKRFDNKNSFRLKNRHQQKQQLHKQKYMQSIYFAETQTPYNTVISDKGVLGEFFTFLELNKLPGMKRFIFNAYVPKSDDSVTEIDIIFIHNTGIYCIESKNYGGWIYGRQQSPYWTQTFKTGKKSRFFNPILQNEGHVNALDDYMKKSFTDSIYSVIVFSNRCTLKDVNFDSKNITLVKRDDLHTSLKKDLNIRKTVLNDSEIDVVYKHLKSFSNVSEEVKQKHIDDINTRKKSNSKHKIKDKVQAYNSIPESVKEDKTTIIPPVASDNKVDDSSSKLENSVSPEVNMKPRLTLVKPASEQIKTIEDPTIIDTIETEVENTQAKIDKIRNQKFIKMDEIKSREQEIEILQSQLYQLDKLRSEKIRGSKPSASSKLFHGRLKNVTRSDIGLAVFVIWCVVLVLKLI